MRVQSWVLAGSAPAHDDSDGGRNEPRIKTPLTLIEGHIHGYIQILQGRRGVKQKQQAGRRFASTFVALPDLMELWSVCRSGAVGSPCNCHDMGAPPRGHACGPRSGPGDP